MAERGMELARGAHREGLRELQPPPPRRAPAWPDIPHLPDPPPYRSTRFNELFIELTHCVRQSILLEARLDAGTCDRLLPGAAPAPRPAQDKPEPSTLPQPDRLEGHPRLAHERLEDDLTAEALRSVPKILTEICEKLGRAADTTLATNLPRTLFPAPPRPNPPQQKYRRDPPDTPAQAPPAKTPIAIEPDRPPPPD